MDLLYAKVVWSCRRGMKELDLILHPFVVQQFEQLTSGQKTDLIALLALDDLTLFGCFFQHAILADPKLQAMVKLLRQFKRPDVEC